MKRLYSICTVLVVAISVANLQSCKDDDPSVVIHNMAMAEKVSVDRFSTMAGHLMVRTATNGLPAANAPVNFDQGSFITKGKGPAGQNVEYYNFDVQSTTPAPIYVLFREGASDPVEGQFNIIDVLPGEAGYNDFWQVHKVTVPQEYQANQVASYAEIQSAKYMIEPITTIVNCPVVPDGSTATKRLGGSADLTKGWYKGKAVSYFNFTEKSLAASGGDVPLSTIYVTFNINPDLAGGGPPSGFVTESGSLQTHNVVATLPSDPGYSPLWVVDAYDNASFTTVSNLNTATAATSKGVGLATVNCPIVTIQ